MFVGESEYKSRGRVDQDVAVRQSCMGELSRDGMLGEGWTGWLGGRGDRSCQEPIGGLVIEGWTMLDHEACLLLCRLLLLLTRPDAALDVGPLGHLLDCISCTGWTLKATWALPSVDHKLRLKKSATALVCLLFLPQSSCKTFKSSGSRLENQTDKGSPSSKLTSILKNNTIGQPYAANR